MLSINTSGILRKEVRTRFYNPARDVDKIQNVKLY